ncbi:hypothetical protein [Allorhodopirellula heiligendammensis]|uniref:Uncharacterized protein n=1 Tax=Allorhodopirellula heiligendammensis TaxID=2714739 RepID=A0A5C6C5E2_9BACT|nr:hypothetical protein [Allorhodopirellula heiligendammensis]TWU19398.1 hypothetical protein Poly21_15710 [Allorhodopirellula heiligendammensis]
MMTQIILLGLISRVISRKEFTRAGTGPGRQNESGIDTKLFEDSSVREGFSNTRNPFSTLDKSEKSKDQYLMHEPEGHIVNLGLHGKLQLTR